MSSTKKSPKSFSIKKYRSPKVKFKNLTLGDRYFLQIGIIFKAMHNLRRETPLHYMHITTYLLLITHFC